MNLLVTTAPAQIGLSPGNLGSDTNGTSDDAQGERFSTHELSSSRSVISSSDTTTSHGTISSRGIDSSRDTTSSRGTTPSRDITPSCVATSYLGAKGLPSSVCGLIYPPRDEPVPSRQVNTAHASESATVNSPATAPTAAPIAPSALAATRLRDIHGPVAPPDPPWTPTTTSLIPEQGAFVKFMAHPQTASGWQHAQLRPVILR